MVDGGALLVLLVLVLLATIGLELGIVLGLTAVIGFYFLSGGGLTALNVVGSLEWSIMRQFILASVPLFVLMGNIVTRTRMAASLLDAVEGWLSFLPGGLPLSVIVSSGLFAATSGSSAAVGATVSAATFPELQRRGVRRDLTLGSLVAGGTLGIMIPPSIPLIIYGVQVQQSIGQLFLGGVVPGLLLVLAFGVYIVVHSMLWPSSKVQLRRRTWSERLRSTVAAVPVVVLIVSVLGSIYTGLATPTEAAAVGAFTSLVIAAFQRELSVPLLRSSLRATARITSMIFLLVLGGQILGNFLTFMHVPQAVTSALTALDIPPLVLVLAIYAVLTVLGGPIDELSLMVVTLPIVYPLLTTVGGLHPIAVGICYVLILEIGLITPPVAINLSITQSSTGAQFGETMLGALPFAGILWAMLVLVTLFPQIALWLPQLVYGAR